MTQLIASNQLTLTNVIDGKTSYHHWAYADNADGTGLTLTDNGQRYMGYYTDYTQADSTDKTKYKWADRWAKIELGGRNFALSTETQTYGNQGRIYTLSSESFKWQTSQKLYLTFDYVASTNVNGFRLNRVIKYKNGTNDQWNFTTNYKALGKEYIDTSLVKSGTYSQPWEWKPYTDSRTSDLIEEIFLNLNLESGSSGTVVISKLRVNTGTLSMDWLPAPEDVENKLDSKADQAKVVYKTDISVTDEGIVHSASKTVNGQTIASMISQRAEWVEIIANLLKVKGDMIVDGTIGANKLSVSTLSALTADLGQISGGSLELLKSEAQGTSIDAWGNFTIPAHKWGLYIDNIGAISSGTPVRKSASESTASDMPVAVLTSGQLRFARVDQNNDLGSVLHYGLSDPDNATISFAVASDGTKQLLIQANGQIVNQGTNYTGWTSTGVSGVYYKRQGDVVALKMQVTTTANQTYGLGKIPVSLLPIQNAGTMMRVTAWTADQGIGRNLQINSDGSMDLLSSNRGDTINTQVTWII